MRTLVFVHGFMGGSAQWDCLRPRLSDKFDLITVDLPGFGANSHLPVLDRIDGFADWVTAELRAKGIERYHLLGHSMGGMIAQEIARKDAERIDRLVLYATGSVGVIPGRFETISESKARAQADGAQATAHRISATWFLENEAASEYDSCSKIAKQASLPAILAGLDAMEGWSGKDALSKLEFETLVLWGDKDRTYSWEQTQILWSQIPKANLAVVPGCAHAVHLEKTDLFTSLLIDHLLG